MPPVPSTSSPPAIVAPHGRSAEAAARFIVEQLEEEIVLGRMQPRERLVEDVLTERFDVKRHVVREALGQLERMGLVDRQPNRGAAVRMLTPEQAEDVYGVRQILEVAAARAVKHRATAQTVDALTAVQHRHDKATRNGDLTAAFRFNIEFHRTFFAACGNEELSQAIEHYGQKAHGIRSFSITRPDYLKRSRDEHWMMIRALQDGDGLKLVALCRDHIQAAKIAYIDAYHARFSVRKEGSGDGRPPPERPSGAPFVGG